MHMRLIELLAMASPPAGNEPQQNPVEIFMRMGVPIAIMVGVMYMLLIRPQLGIHRQG